jgi:HEAT repeat protein
VVNGIVNHGLASSPWHVKLEQPKKEMPMMRLVLVSLAAILVLPSAAVLAEQPHINLPPGPHEVAYYAAKLDALLPGMADADPGKRFSAMNEFSKMCLNAGRPGADDERMAVCKAILPRLTGDSPPRVRAWLLRQLQWIGKDEVVAALAPILQDKDLMVRDCARRALEANPSPEAGAALRAAMPKADSEESLVGLINSLAVRRDAAAAAAIAEALKDKRSAVVLAAVAGLGRIGTTEAAAALAKVQPGENAALRQALQDAEIICAERLLADGDKDAAGAIYNRLFGAADNPTAVRVAALRGMVATEGDKSVELLVSTLALLLEGKDTKLQPYVVPLLMEIKDPGAARAVAGILPSVPPAAQVPLLEMLRGRADPSTRPAILAAMKSSDGSVRIAATRALVAVGTVEDVPALIEAAVSSDAGLRDAARASLDRLPVSANAALLAALDKVLPAPLGTADAKARLELIRTLAARRVAAAIPALLKATRAPDEARLEALKGLEAIGDDSTIGDLAYLTNHLQSGEDERQAAEKALFAVAARAANPRAVTETLTAAMPKADNLAKQSILGALRRTGTPQALAAIRAALKDSDAAVQTAALRALAEWPDASSMDDLVAIAKSDPKDSSQVLAIRGLVRVTTMTGVTPARQIEVLTLALAAAKRPEDKKLVLGAIGTMKSIEALRLAAPLVADNDLKEEAAAAVVQIAKALPAPLPAEVRPALEKVAGVTASDRLRREAQDLLGKMPK